MLDFLRYTRELLLLAFSTSSSAAVMPMSLQTAENVLHIRPDLARFLIPLGATINMTGTALYQGVATVSLAHVFNVDLGTHHYLFIVTMSVAASIGSPATPGAGIVILSMYSKASVFLRRVLIVSWICAVPPLMYSVILSVVAYWILYCRIRTLQQHL